MENMITVKGPVIAGIGAVGGVIAGFFGGWDAALITLLIFMGVDYITGLIVAGVFKNSTKTDSGALGSNAAFMGLLRKGMGPGGVSVRHYDRHKLRPGRGGHCVLRE